MPAIGKESRAAVLDARAGLGDLRSGLIFGIGVAEGWIFVPRDFPLLAGERFRGVFMRRPSQSEGATPTYSLGREHRVLVHVLLPSVDF
jgi:hypothetical protein